MKPWTLRTISSQQLSSATSASVVTATIPTQTSAILVSVETTSARVTFDGTAPDATHGQVFPTGLAPVLLPVGPGATVKAASTSGAAASVINLTYLA